MSTRASVAIFEGKEIEIAERDVKPVVPDEVFEAVKRVSENKGCEMVKTRSGLFVISYSPTGPFQTEVSNEWLPVYICRVRKWDSGGVMVGEMDEYNSNKT